MYDLDRYASFSLLSHSLDLVGYRMTDSLNNPSFIGETSANYGVICSTEWK
jgi:hypothetical protein